MEIKKNPRKDVNRLKSLWFNVGLFVSMCLIIMAFEWHSYGPKVTLDSLYAYSEDSYDPPVTIPDPPKPKPKPVIANPIEKHDDEPDEKIEDFTFDLPSIGDIEPPELPDIGTEEVDDPPVGTWEVEKMPEPEGGYETFYKFISKNIKYPAQARRMSVEGKVYVQFVVDKDGNLTEFEIVRGIGAGCDEEVLRLMQIAPKWNPGKQRGKPVKVRMLIPVNFQLN